MVNAAKLYNFFELPSLFSKKNLHSGIFFVLILKTSCIEITFYAFFRCLFKFVRIQFDF